MNRDPLDNPNLPPPEVPEFLDSETEHALVPDDDAPMLPAQDSESPLDVEPVYDIWRTSRYTAGGEPIPLTLRVNDDGSTWRRVLSYEFVNNQRNPPANVHLKIHHQRRSRSKSAWAPVPTFKAMALKAGHEVMMDLHADEVRALQAYVSERIPATE